MTVPSYPPPGYPAPAPRTRPTTVTVASYLLYVVAGIQVLNALLTFSTASAMTEAVRGAFAGTEAEGAEAFVTGVLIAGGIINLLIGAGFAVLSFFNSRGKNPSRIVTWVIGGISLCCLGLGLGGTGLSSLGTGTGVPSEPGVPSDVEIERRIADAVPGWYEPATTGLTVLALLAILGVVILLALPASNEFFRKPAPGFDPAMGYPPPGYGQYGGGQPGYPGGPAPYPGAGPAPYPGAGPAQPGNYQPYPGQQPPPSYGSDQPSSGLPSYPGPEGQPGQPAPGLPPYPGQPAPPPASDPYAPPPSPPRDSDDQPPKPPTNPA